MNHFAQVVILAASIVISVAALGETGQYPITLEIEPNEDPEQVALCWSAVEGTYLGAASLFVVSETAEKGIMYPSIEHTSTPLVLAEQELPAGMFQFYVQDIANTPGGDLSQRVRILLSKSSVVTIKQGCGQEAESAAERDVVIDVKSVSRERLPADIPEYIEMLEESQGASVPLSVHLLLVVHRDRASAEATIERLREGATFLDVGGRDLGWNLLTDLRPEVLEALGGLSVGDYTKPVPIKNKLLIHFVKDIKIASKDGVGYEAQAVSEPAASSERAMVLQATTGSAMASAAELARSAEGRPISKTVAIAEPNALSDDLINLSLDGAVLAGLRYEKLELVLESLGTGGGLLVGEGATYLIKPGTEKIRLGNFSVSTLNAEDWCLVRMKAAETEPELEGKGITVRRVNRP